MRKTDRAFSPSELKAMLWGVLAAAVIGGSGLMVKEMLSPSLGLYGAEGFAAASLPGVMDARPIGA